MINLGFYGYEYTRNNQGKPVAVDRMTGEVGAAETITVPVGSVIYTPQDQERYRKWKEQQERERLEAEAKKKRHKTATEMGAHFFMNGSQDFGDLAPATVTRLIYLATYCGYSEQGNKLMRTSKTQMHKEDLADVLKVSKATAGRFLEEVSPRYVIKSEGGLLSLNEEIFIKGSLNRQHSYYRAYAEPIRKLYNMAEKAQHKQLGYIFQLLPHVSIEYNALSHNPQEKDFDLVEFLTLDEFLEKIGYNKSDRHRLIKIYDSLVFPIGDHMERFCSVVSNGIPKDIGKARLYVNPNIMYSGSRKEEVKILGKFCKT